MGTLDFAFADIAPLAALANQTAQGDMNGTIRFAETGGTPEIALDGKASAITRGDLSVQDVSIGVVIPDYLATPVISGRVQAATLTAGNTVVRDIDVALRRDGVWTGFDGGAIVSGIPARAAGRLQIADGGVAIELSGGEASLQDFKATLAQPSTIRIAGGTTTLDALTLEVAGGTAVLSGAVGAALDLTATFSAPQDGAPLTFGGSDNPINLTIKSASVRATGNAAEPRLDIATLLSKVSTNSGQSRQSCPHAAFRCLQHRQPGRPSEGHRDSRCVRGGQCQHRATGFRQVAGRTCRRALHRCADRRGGNAAQRCARRRVQRRCFAR